MTTPAACEAALAQARAALDRAADELVAVLALDGLPDTVRRGAAVALRAVAGTHAMAEAIGEGAVEEPACDRTGTHAELVAARGPGDVTRSTCSACGAVLTLTCRRCGPEATDPEARVWRELRASSEPHDDMGEATS